MPKKRDIFVEIFQNLPKSGFFDLFFHYLPATQIVWSKMVFILFRYRSKNLFGLPEKMVDKTFESFLKSAPSRNS